MVAYPDPNKFRKSVEPGVRPDSTRKFQGGVPVITGRGASIYNHLFIWGIDFCIAFPVRIWYVVGINVSEG